MACISRTLLPALVLLLALAVGVGLVLAAGGPGDEGNGSPPGDGVWETEGDWVVEDGEDLVYENLTLIVNGNLTVDFGGKLTLRDVKVTMNLTDDLQFWVRVRTGGEMVLSDADGNASTTGDRTTIGSWFASARYTIGVDNGGRLHVLRSRVADLGDLEVTGLRVSSDDVLFEDSSLESFSSMLVEDASPVFRRTRLTGDLESSLYFDRSGALLEDCRVINCYYGVNVRGKPSPEVRGTDVANCFFPLNLVNAEVRMEGGMLESAPYGIDVRLNGSSKAVLVDVDFDQGKMELLDPGSMAELRWTLSLQVTDQLYQPIEDARVAVNDTMGTRVFEGRTNALGVVDVEVLDRVVSQAGLEHHNPQEIMVDKGRYHAVLDLNVTTTMSWSVTVMTNVAPVISVLSPLPGTRVVMGQTLTFDASPTYDPNGDEMTFEWVTDIADRLLYSGPDAVFQASLLLGEKAIKLTVSDGHGGVNSTTVQVTVLQASQDSLQVVRPQFIATMEVTYGGTGSIDLAEADPPTSYPPELIGVFLFVRATGEAILASGDLEVTYDTDLLPFGMDEATLTIAREDGGIWVEVEGAWVDTDAHTVGATIDRLGVYTVKGVMPPNVPPRLRMLDGTTAVLPHSVEVELLDEVDLQFTVLDELPAFCTLEVEDLPDFLHLDGSTKRIYGTAPHTAGSHELWLAIVDIGGLDDQALIYLNVTGTLDPPTLYSGIADPLEGDTRTNFELTVVYVSPEDLPPVYVRARIKDDTLEMVRIDPEDYDWDGGVMYQVRVRLEEGTHKVTFETSDGYSENATVTPVKIGVADFVFEPTSLEWAILVATALATIVVVLVIRRTSERYKKLKEAHYGKDREDRVDYISPRKVEVEVEEPGTAPGGEPTEAVDEAEEIEEEAEPVHTLVVDDDDMRVLEEDVDRLERELGELDEEIDTEEEELARIDEEIEEIIDELDEDRERTG